MITASLDAEKMSLQAAVDVQANGLTEGMPVQLLDNQNSR
jgi:hypothetical protein